MLYFVPKSKPITMNYDDWKLQTPPEQPETPEEIEDKHCFLCNCHISTNSSITFYFAGHDQLLCRTCNTRLEWKAFKNLINPKKMKIENPKISMLISADSTEIEIIDSKANITLVIVKLTPEQLSLILSRRGHVDCEASTGDLTKIGKTHENKKFEFEITYSNSKFDLQLACGEALFNQSMFEWESDNYYNSQDSFFEKNGKRYARTTIRRWI